MNAFGLPDPIPVQREPIYTPHVELVSKYPTLPDFKQFRLPNIGGTGQKTAGGKGNPKQIPLVLGSGTLREEKGGAGATRPHKVVAPTGPQTRDQKNTPP